MDNTFTIADYFARNFGLPDRPVPYKFGKKNFLVLVILCWFWIPYYIIRKSMSASKIKAWDNDFEYRRTHWPVEYDKEWNRIISSFDLKADALKKLNLTKDDLETEPLFFYGTLWEKPIYYRTYNGVFRPSKRQLVMIFFTSEQILIYKRKINMYEPMKKSESTMEYFYSDVTSITLSTETQETGKDANLDGEGDSEVEEQKVKIVVPGDSQLFSINNVDESVENSINAMRSLLREKKKANR